MVRLSLERFFSQLNEVSILYYQMKHVLTNQSGLLVVGIHKDRFSRDTTHLFIITTRKTRFYDLASALFTGHILPLLNLKR